MFLGRDNPGIRLVLDWKQQYPVNSLPLATTGLEKPTFQQTNLKRNSEQRSAVEDYAGHHVDQLNVRASISATSYIGPRDTPLAQRMPGTTETLAEFNVIYRSFNPPLHDAPSRREKR